MMRKIALALVMERGQVIALDAEVGLTLQDFAHLLARRSFISHLREAACEQREMEMIRRSDALHGLGRLAIAARDEKCPAEMAPEARGVVGIEAHRLPDPFYALFGLAEPGQQLALLHHDQVVVGIQAERALLVVDRFFQ